MALSANTRAALAVALADQSAANEIADRLGDNASSPTLVVGSTTLAESEIDAVDGATGHVLQAKEITFTETAGAGTYTGAVTLPAGSTIHDIIVNGVALWDNAGACTLTVGDGVDPDGYYTAVNLKATDLLAGESLSFALAGGKAGAYIANSQVSPRYNAAAPTITAAVVTASTGGTAGRTRVMVVYSAPSAAHITAATKA